MMRTPLSAMATNRLVVLLLALVIAGCGSTAATTTSASTATTDSSTELETLRVYTTVTEATVNAVVTAFGVEHPQVTFEVFRAPTGEVAARIAAEMREGGLQADVLWLTDPLSMQQYEIDGLLRSWTPEEVGAVPEGYRSTTFFGTRILNMVIVHQPNLADPPSDWADLAGVDGVVAIPDPAFAGSAFGALAYFDLTDEYGLEFYQSLKDNGAIQVQSPTDVVNGVAEGLYAAGMTLDQGARAAIADGSPLTMVWPSSGAVAIYSPIGVVAATGVRAAEAFVNFVLGPTAQSAIAETGWQPIRSDVDWPDNGTAATVDWATAFTLQEELLNSYATIFSGS
jgi:iron(III) transport system substrate-binding protein